MALPPTVMSRSLSDSSASPRLPTNACATTTERVPTRTAGEIASDPFHRRGEHRVVTGADGAERVPGELGLEVRERIDRDRAVVVGEEHRIDDARLGAEVHPGIAEEAGTEAEAARRSRGCR